LLYAISRWCSFAGCVLISGRRQNGRPLISTWSDQRVQTPPLSMVTITQKTVSKIRIVSTREFLVNGCR